MPGSAVNLQQLLRMQGLVWGDSATHDYHIWFEGGILYTDARISAVAVGDSLKPLTNYVPATLVANAYPTTTITGTGTASKTAFTLTGLPATAVAADLLVTLSPGAGFAAGNNAGIFTNTSQAGPSIVTAIYSASVASASANGRLPVTPGATNQLAYNVPSITGGAQWSLIVTLLGWYEPA